MFPVFLFFPKRYFLSFPACISISLPPLVPTFPSSSSPSFLPHGMAWPPTCRRRTLQTSCPVSSCVFPSFLCAVFFQSEGVGLLSFSFFFLQAEQVNVYFLLFIAVQKHTVCPSPLSRTTWRDPPSSRLPSCAVAQQACPCEALLSFPVVRSVGARPDLNAYDRYAADFQVDDLDFSVCLGDEVRSSAAIYSSKCLSQFLFRYFSYNTFFLYRNVSSLRPPKTCVMFSASFMRSALMASLEANLNVIENGTAVAEAMCIHEECVLDVKGGGGKGHGGRGDQQLLR